jgi:histidinol-phosphatase
MAYEREMTIVAEIARRSGDLALQIRQGDIDIEIKDDASPVTVADKACEKLIVEQLMAAFPGDGVLGEEGAERESTNGRRWIIDPIDGTRDFIRGTRAWSVLIGLEAHGEVVAGHAYYPAYGEIYSAAKGEGAWHDGKRIHAGDPKKKADALMCCNGLGFMHRYKFSKDLIVWLADFWTVRSMGGCLDAVLVASGVADVWLEAQAKPWDLAPLKIIAEEAGCVTFDFKGENTIYGGNFAISTPALAAEIKAFLAQG